LEQVCAPSLPAQLFSLHPLQKQDSFIVILYMAMMEVTTAPTAPDATPEGEELTTTTDMVKMTEAEAAELGLVELIARLEWRHVVNRVKESPGSSRKKQSLELDGTETTGYPLHLAVSLKPPVSFHQFLPSRLRWRARLSNESIPAYLTHAPPILHRRLLQRHVVDALLEGNPAAIRSRDDKFGQLPLHIACIHTASAQVLRALVEGHTEALRITDKEYGRLPLHFACLYGSPFEISLLVSAEQRALIFKDADGKTPMDLAEGSNNLHREAILKRLEDRTRVVTEAMIQRRKQQQLDAEQPAHKNTRSALRRASSKRGGMMSDASTSTDDEKRRTKSMGLGVNDEEAPLRRPSGTLSRTKSMTLSGAPSQPLRRRSGRSSKSGSSSLASEDKRNKFPRAYTTDDAEIGKKSKSSRRKRDSSKTSSRSKNSRGGSVPIVANNEEEEVDVEKTPKLKNGKDSMLARLKADYEDDRAPAALQAEPLGFMNSNREQIEPRRDKLAMFLQAHAKDDSSDDDYEVDHKSMGAQSLPALMYSHFSKQQNNVEFEENKRIAKSYMFEDSSDDGGGLDTSPKFSRGSATDDGGPRGPKYKKQQSSELASVEDRIGNLDVRRQALSQECEAIYETVGKKEDAAHHSREVINELQMQIAELQERLQREQGSLVLSETGIQLQKETLAVHEIKIKAVDSEMTQLFETKRRLETLSVSKDINSD
jgi:hypothetical protein